MAILFEKKNSKRKIFLIWVIFSAALIVPCVFRYLSLHTHYWDMGTYQHFLWNYSYKDLPAILVFNNHFSPVLIVFAALYKLLPYGETLLVLQSLSLSIAISPLYAYAKDMLGEKKAIKVVYLFCLFSPIWFVNLSDFHPDSLIIPLGLSAFYFLKTRRLYFFFLSIILMLTIKEISFFIAAMIGIYAALKYRLYAVGYSLFFVAVA